MDSETQTLLRDWIQVDNLIRVRRDKMNELYEQRKHLEQRLENKVKEQRLNNVKVNVSDGSIKFLEKQAAQSMTLSYVKDQLEAYFKQAQERNERVSAGNAFVFLKDNRKANTSFEVHREIKEDIEQ
jgi:hypothetical protein